MNDPGAFPAWLHGLAIVSLSLGLICAVTIALDELRRPQQMWVMDVVWPVTAPFGGVLWLAGYYAWGRTPAKGGAPEPPMAAAAGTGSSHYGTRPRSRRGNSACTG